MCGRAKLETDVSEIKIAFRIPPEYPRPNFPPSWNVAPTDNLPIIRYDAKAGHRTLDVIRWGLVPYWARDIALLSAGYIASPFGRLGLGVVDRGRPLVF